MKLAKAVALCVPLALFVLSAGCFRTGYGRNIQPEPMPRYSAWHSHVLWGIVSLSPDVDLDGVCPDAKPVRVQSFIGPLGALVGIFTAGIWVPTTVQVWCAAGGPPVAVDLNAPTSVETTGPK